MRENFYRQFEHLGISRERVEIHGQKPAVEYMQLYNSVDIAFDTYPYNGTTTTCDSLWMGVPVISMVGRHHASRVGLSIFTRVGLEFFAASTRNEFVARATALAQNLEALVDIRFSMRRRMTESSLCNAGDFACSVEQAYREMWHKWCKNKISIIQSSTT
jgi:predicted O-linked N-acetylglucosamine transferase (SPINDLY family)